MELLLKAHFRSCIPSLTIGVDAEERHLFTTGIYVPESQCAEAAAASLPRLRKPSLSTRLRETCVFAKDPHVLLHLKWCFCRTIRAQVVWEKYMHSSVAGGFAVAIQY